MSELNLDDMKPFSYISFKLPQEYEEDIKQLRRLAEFMVQRAMQIESECLERPDDNLDLIYGNAVRQIEAYEDAIGEAVRDEKSV